MSQPRTGDDKCMARNEKAVTQIFVGEPGRYARMMFARAAVARLLRGDGPPADDLATLRLAAKTAVAFSKKSGRPVDPRVAKLASADLVDGNPSSAESSAVGGHAPEVVRSLLSSRDCRSE